MQQEKVSDQMTKEKSTAFKLKDKNMKQSKVNESVKTLGVLMKPSLNWNDEFEYARNKLIMSIKKTMRVQIIMCQV